MTGRTNTGRTTKTSCCQPRKVKSSCPALSKAVTLRHNEAGTAILKAIHQGCKGCLLLTSDVSWRKRHDKETEPPLPQAATTRRIQVNHLTDSIPIHIKDALN
jgi:hypothetical protein